MDFRLSFKNQLNKLIENEENFDFFRNFAIEHMSYNPKFFKESFDELLMFAKENKLNRTQGWIYYYLGWYYVDTAYYEKAVDIFLVSNEIFQNIDDKRGLSYACNGLTNVYTQIGQFKLANEWGLKGILLAEGIDDKEALLILLVNTSINYVQMKSFHKAKEILDSIEMAHLALTKEQRVIYLLILAEVEINIGNPYIAIKYVDEAYKLEDKPNINTCSVYKIKGTAFVKLDEYDIAEKEFIKSIDIAIELGYVYEKCCALAEWANLCILVGRFREAIEMLSEVAAVSKYKKFYTLSRQSNHTLYAVYKKMDCTEEALKYLEEYIIIDDHIYDYEQNQIMAKMNMKQTERKADLYKLLYDKTELLSTIGQKIISNLDIRSIIDVINKEINKLIKTDIFGIALYDEDKQEAVYNFVNGYTETKKIISFRLDDDYALGAYCIRNREDIIINNLQQEYSKYANTYFYADVKENEQIERSMIFTPLIINDKVVGVITVQSYVENSYDNNDLNTLKIIGNYSAIALHNAMSYKRIEEIATYDKMTGFLTRFEIIRLGELFFKRYSDDGNKHFSIIMIDLDNFKSINDTYGHVYGDRAINMVTETISKCIRTTDHIGRYGGDEFLLICPATTEEEAIEVAERIRKTISKEIYFLDNDIIVHITISLGVYEFRKDDLSFIDGVKEADKFLYLAKKGAKNRVVYKKLIL